MTNALVIHISIRFEKLQELHKKYGHMVRIAQKKISVSDKGKIFRHIQWN